jgi:NADH:ubiquinone oxidoreductase subunit 2 (subunit N)
MVPLAAAGALNSVLSLFYYFRIGRALFFEEAGPEVPGRAPGAERLSGLVTVFVIIAAAALLVLGVLPDLLSGPAASGSLGR